MQNIKMINDYMRKKEEGLNMSEMIHAHLEDIKDKDAAAMVELIDDAFFQEETVKGLTFQVRRSNFMRGHRTLNIVDEIEEKLKVQQAIQEAEAKRDMIYEEYLEKY
jgi:hypothetical protein